MNKQNKEIPRTIPSFLAFILTEIIEQKKWLLFPIWILLLVIGILILLSGSSILLPAIYIAF